MRYLSLCSGIEAATVAWHPMGWEPAAFAEIEAFPAAVLRHHYPNTPNLGDMTKWREWNVGSIDLLVGGTPCQSFSVAGLRKGLSDPRGGLMLTFLEIAQSLRPRWVVWENVPGVLSSGGGRDFGAFLGALGELGYGWAYRVLDAQWCRVDGYERAVPQRRRRVFVVGCLGDATRAAQVLFERQSVERNPAPRRAKGQGAAADAEDGVETGGWMPNNPGVVSSVCAKWAKKTGGPSGSEHFNLTMEPASKWPAEVCSTLNASFGEKQGLEDQHALGGAQCFVPAVAGTIDCDIPKQRVQNMAAGHWLAVPIQDGREIAKAQNGLGIGGEGDPSYTLDQTGAQSVAIQGNLIGRDVGGPQAVAVPFRKSHRAASATDDESWVRAETANTLNRFDTGERDTHAIAFTQNQREEVRELGPVTGALSGQGTHQTTYIAATIDMQACKGNANIGDGSVSPTPCKPSGSDVHAVAIDLYNQAIDGDCAATLTEACGGTNISGPKVMQVAHGFYSTDGTHGVNMEPEVSPAVKVGSGLGIPSPPTVAFKPSHFTRGKDGSPADITPPLSADADKGDQDTVVAMVMQPLNFYGGNRRADRPEGGFYVKAEETSKTLDAASGLNPTCSQGGTAVMTAMQVRRLTPVECERLQGFPDDYTNIPWRGKPESPDGPRYKALGNSMAVNCMRWIGRRIDAVEKGTELPA